VIERNSRLLARIIGGIEMFRAKRTDCRHLREYSPDFAQWKWGVLPGRTMTLAGG
jgi:hypothetical protein